MTMAFLGGLMHGGGYIREGGWGLIHGRKIALRLKVKVLF